MMFLGSKPSYWIDETLMCVSFSGISDSLASFVRYESVGVGHEWCLERQLSVCGFSNRSGSYMNRSLCAASPHKNPDHIVKIKQSGFLEILFAFFLVTGCLPWLSGIGRVLILGYPCLSLSVILA